MSVGRHWLWNDKPQKSLTKLTHGKADLSGGWNRTVAGEAAFCGCCLPLLIGRWGCFLCSFLGVCALLPQLVIHCCFARRFSKQWANWPSLNFSQGKSILGAQLPEFWWEKGFLCRFFLSIFISISILKLWYQNIILGKGTHPWLLLFTEIGSKAKRLLLLSREKIIP